MPTKRHKLLLVGGGEFAKLGDGGGDDFERGGDLLCAGVAAKAEADAGTSVFRRKADGGEDVGGLDGA